MKTTSKLLEDLFESEFSQSMPVTDLLASDLTCSPFINTGNGQKQQRDCKLSELKVLSKKMIAKRP
ncbi:hypothetical protein EOD39_6387 [Acipenser ruthenus]|uniref:Uncharacterized protein n=1 Tax=Acipenser ruthenus TaxID=7906 RepID=A0A662Z164_ACIRT|nr:hypothetical protein EOD39_6387 [Acipenser ruthenus]